MKNYYVYITTNPDKTVLYIGVTNNITTIILEHEKNGGNTTTFAGKYFCYNLIYYEVYESITVAIDREKQLKKWSRIKKEKLISKQNPSWKFVDPLQFSSF